MPSRKLPALALAATAGTTLAVVAGPRPFGPAPSQAHTSVQSQTPAPGRTTKTSLRLVSVVIAGADSARITVTGPGGKTVSGATKRNTKFKQRFQTTLRSGLKAGSYRATVKYTGGDGHKQSATWTFRLAK